MSDNQDVQDTSRLDEATSVRLSRLRTMPVDTSRLDASLCGQIPAARPLRAAWAWGRPLRAAAAVLVTFGVVAAILLSSSGGPALASAAQMAQMHDDLVSGKTPVMQVTSVDEANRALNAQWPGSPGIPSMPADHVMACCMKSVKNKKVACVLLKTETEPVTMTVANASDMKMPTSPTQVQDGITYHVQSFNDLNMVMTERNERWICLIGRLPVGKLMDLATKLSL